MTLDKSPLLLRTPREKLLESRTSMLNKTSSALLLERMLIEFPKTATILERTSKTLRLETVILEVLSEAMIFKSKKRKITCSESEKISRVKPTPTPT